MLSKSRSRSSEGDNAAFGASGPSLVSISGANLAISPADGPNVLRR